MTELKTGYILGFTYKGELTYEIDGLITKENGKYLFKRAERNQDSKGVRAINLHDFMTDEGESVVIGEGILHTETTAETEDGDVCIGVEIPNQRPNTTARVNYLTDDEVATHSYIRVGVRIKYMDNGEVGSYIGILGLAKLTGEQLDMTDKLTDEISEDIYKTVVDESLKLVMLLRVAELRNKVSKTQEN